MFTGIIEEMGTIQQINQSGEAIVMTLGAEKVLTDVNLGDSISVNGVCLTVTSFTPTSFTVDLMPETVRSSSLKDLTAGSKVNLERAMGAGGRFGGHFVSGHVDGVGTIVNRKEEQNAIYYEIKIPAELRKYMMMKGSVAVDGTSLTIFGVTDNTFTVSLIPHTVQETVIGQKKKGSIVNIECDMLAKYVAELVLHQGQNQKKPAISKNFLRENGYNV